MDTLHQIIHFILTLDHQLLILTQTYGVWIYAILFTIVFCEAGIIVTPFLPGDSLLFAAGSIAAIGKMDFSLLCVLLIVAAVVGGIVNYYAGRWCGHKLQRFIRPQHLQQAHQFYEKYGAKTIFIARFVPIVRTIAPFIAGVAVMPARAFHFHNLLSGIVWIMLLISGGFYFGNLPFVRENFSLVIFGVIIVSLLPIAYAKLAQNNP